MGGKFNGKHISQAHKTHQEGEANPAKSAQPEAPEKPGTAETPTQKQEPETSATLSRREAAKEQIAKMGKQRGNAY